MTKGRRRKAGALTALLALAFSVSAIGGEFRAGAAAADITPDLSAMKVPSSGFGCWVEIRFVLVVV